MSININGNNLNRFGQKLPTPYLEKIWVTDNTFKIGLSFYFEGIIGEPEFSLTESVTTPFIEYLYSLSDLNFNIVAIVDGKTPDPQHASSWADIRDVKLMDANDTYEKYGPIDYGPTGTKLFQKLIAQKISIFDIAKYDPHIYGGEGSWTELSDYMEKNRFLYKTGPEPEDQTMVTLPIQ